MVDEHVERFLAAKGISKKHESLLLGVSGGLDSTVLCRVIVKLGYRAQLAHVNYGLRSTAHGDERFVSEMADELHVPLHVWRADARAFEEGGSLQETAREIRYDYFAEIAEQQELSLVAVAQHADDQAETVLINLFRGAGMEGLGGMKDERLLHTNRDVVLIRPLLELPRQALRKYARERGWTWRDDPTNKDQTYLRNAIRHDILPLIEKHAGEGVGKKIVETARMARQYWQYSLEPELKRRFAACRADGDALLLDELRGQPEVWQHRLVLEALKKWLPGVPFRRSVAREISELISAQPGKKSAYDEGTIWRDRDRLFFARDDEEERGEVHVLHVGGSINMQDYSISAQCVNAFTDQMTDTDSFTAWLSSDAIRTPFRVRTWRDGDRIQPLGMNGSKTVSDLLTDEKIEPHRKSRQLVVEDGEGIVWVVGVRISDRVKLTSKTQNAIVLRAMERN